MKHPSEKWVPWTTARNRDPFGLAMPTKGRFQERGQRGLWEASFWIQLKQKQVSGWGAGRLID